MSNSTQDSGNDYSEIQNFVIQTRAIVASAAFYCFEWLITMDQEAEHIWARKWSLSTLIFAGSRYATLLLLISELTPAPSRASCVWGIILNEVCIVVQYLALALFTALRTSALCNRSIWVFLVVLGFSGVQVVSNVVIFIKAPIEFAVATPTNICDANIPFSGAQELGISLSRCIAAIIADIIALAVAWNKAVGTVRQASRLHIKVPLGRVLIEDGTFLFLGLVIINVFQLLADNIPYLLGFQLAGALMTPMQSIVMCRFMLNLKQAGSGPSPTPDNTTFHKSTIRFNANILIGNLGESMSLWDDEDTLEQTDQDENSEKTTITAVEPVDDTRLVAERESERAVKDLRAPIMDPIIISSVVDGVENPRNSSII